MITQSVPLLLATSPTDSVSVREMGGGDILAGVGINMCAFKGEGRCICSSPQIYGRVFVCFCLPGLYRKSK